MKISRECYLCIYTQAFNLTKRLNLNEIKASKVLRGVGAILSKYSLDVTPPKIAAEVYSFISEITGIEDPFAQAKKDSIIAALEYKSVLLRKLLKSENKLYDALKIAASGNVIDLGVNREFDLKKELENIFNVNFAKNDYSSFREKLKDAQTICYLADNAGENVFDEILIQTLKEYNDDLKIYYLVRGKPVINDITIKDLIGLEIFSLAEVIDSGVPTPGFDLSYANEKSKEIFYESDLVISKGMGNFECLYGEANREVFYLFKVKCDVVAREINESLGEYVFFEGKK